MIRVVTYNTRGSLGMDGIRSTGRIADVVRGLAADIVCFQEIHQRLRWSGNEDQPALLGDLLNRAFVFQKNLRFGFGGYGIGIAVRGITSVRKPFIKEHVLPSEREQRGALEVRLRDFAGLRRLTVICTHWGLNADERLRQAEALSMIVHNAPRPLVLCGDLNEGSDGKAFRLLIDKTGLIDADAERNRATFVSDDPKSRIDVILCSDELKVCNVEVISSLASDHLPVMTDLR